MSPSNSTRVRQETLRRPQRHVQQLVDDHTQGHQGGDNLQQEQPQQGHGAATTPAPSVAVPEKAPVSRRLSILVPPHAGGGGGYTVPFPSFRPAPELDDTLIAYQQQFADSRRHVRDADGPLELGAEALHRGACRNRNASFGDKKTWKNWHRYVEEMHRVWAAEAEEEKARRNARPPYPVAGIVDPATGEMVFNEEDWQEVEWQDAGFPPLELGLAVHERMTEAGDCCRRFFVRRQPADRDDVSWAPIMQDIKSTGADKAGPGSYMPPDLTEENKNDADIDSHSSPCPNQGPQPTSKSASIADAPAAALKKPSTKRQREEDEAGETEPSASARLFKRARREGTPVLDEEDDNDIETDSDSHSSPCPQRGPRSMFKSGLAGIATAPAPSMLQPSKKRQREEDSAIELGPSGSSARSSKRARCQGTPALRPGSVDEDYDVSPSPSPSHAEKGHSSSTKGGKCRGTPALRPVSLDEDYDSSSTPISAPTSGSCPSTRTTSRKTPALRHASVDEEYDDPLSPAPAAAPSPEAEKKHSPSPSPPAKKPSPSPSPPTKPTLRSHHRAGVPDPERAYHGRGGRTAAPSSAPAPTPTVLRRSGRHAAAAARERITRLQRAQDDDEAFEELLLVSEEEDVEMVKVEERDSEAPQTRRRRAAGGKDTKRKGRR